MAVGRAIVVVLGLMFVTSGVAGIGLGWFTYQDTQSDLANTVEVEGTVVDTTLVEEEEEVDRDDDGQPDGTRTTYEPVVNYSYSYEGTEYTSESIYPGTSKSFDDRSEAEDVLSGYEAGEPVTVKLNSEEPSRSFLIEEDNSLVTLGVAGGAGTLALIVGLVTIKRGLFASVDEE